MYNERLENLIEAALADGELTEKEKQILFKNAQTMGVDLDEFEMVLDAKLFEKKKEMQKEKATAQPQVSSAPTSNKFGDVRKCPQCGAVVQAMQAICPECGHEFAGVAANSSAMRLSEQLQQVEKDCSSKTYQTISISSDFGNKPEVITEDELRETETCRRQSTIISSFPIPNTKDDLLEFALMMQTGFNTHKKAGLFRTIQSTVQRTHKEVTQSRNKLHEAYVQKYNECINKMKLMFPNDPMFQSLLDQQEAKKEEKKGLFGKLGGLFGK